ncbi:hypothetical protein BDD12DRAFT_890438 [Trichophaea hybrida]|nr:hypothetical protein BDD12DRAFT_890438 [Trichophaea hybrida]
MTYAEVTASPSQRSTSVAPPGTRTPYALNCTPIKVPLKSPGPSTPLQSKPLTPPARTPLAPTPAQRNRNTTPANKSYASGRVPIASGAQASNSHPYYEKQAHHKRPKCERTPEARIFGSAPSGSTEEENGNTTAPGGPERRTGERKWMGSKVVKGCG